MSTRSMIAVMTDETQTQHVYCHSSGDIGGVGALLQRAYPSRAHGQELVARGWLYVLGENVADSVYYRDSVPRLLAGGVSEAMTGIEKWLHYSDEEFAYLHDGTQWLVYAHCHQEPQDPYPLDAHIVRGGWRMLAPAVVADALVSVGLDADRDVRLLWVDPDLRFEARLQAATVRVVNGRTADSYTETAPSFGAALYAALQRLPDAWLRPEVTRFDIGMKFGAQYGFRDFRPELPALGRAPTETSPGPDRGTF